MATSCLPAEGSDNGLYSYLSSSQIIASCSFPIKERTWLHSALPPRPLLAGPHPGHVTVWSARARASCICSHLVEEFTAWLFFCQALQSSVSGSHGTSRPPQETTGRLLAVKNQLLISFKMRNAHFAWNLPCLCCRGYPLLRHRG